MTVRTGANDPNKRSGKWITQARNRLAARREEKPVTKAGQIRALWREIEGALADGQSLKSIREWLEEEGIVVTRATLSSYKRRFRRRDAANRRTEALEAFMRQTGSASQMLVPVQQASAEPPRVADQPERDPFAQARRALEKNFDIRIIHGDGDPTGRNLV
jgi:predicted xylose isomerase-like sugar epimerase